MTYWPAALHRPLLRAAFLSGDAAVSAWEVWKSDVDLDHHPDPGSFRLLPQVCRNLRRGGVEDPLLAKLTGIARQSWFKNQKTFQALVPHVRALRDGGVDVALLGAMALALRSPDSSAPPDPTWSLLVRPEQAGSAFELLQRSGWRAASPPPQALLRAFVAHRPTERFRGPDGQELLLSWRWLPGDPDDDVWPAAEQVELHDVTVALLGPADHMVEVCAEGRPPVARPLFWRAIDVMLIRAAVGGDVDWLRLVAQARRRGVQPWVAETVRYIQDELDAPLPRDLLGALEAVPAAPPMPAGAGAGAGSERPAIRHELARLWSSYREHSGRLDLGRRLYYFPKYLQYVWRLDSVRQVPRRALASTLYLLR